MSFDEVVNIYSKSEDGIFDKKSDATIKVNAASSAIAFIYEKLRVAVEFKSEHLLRRLAIERILNRKIKLSLKREGMGLFIIKELLRARYLPNNKIPESVALKIDETLKKYFELIDSHSSVFKKSKNDIVEWLISVASYDIERVFEGSEKRDALANLMAELLAKESSYNISDLKVACQIALNRADRPILRFDILYDIYPTFFKNGDNTALKELSVKLENLIDEIDEKIARVESGQILKFCKRQTAPFIILSEILRKDTSFASSYKEKTTLDIKVRNMCALKYKELSERLRRMVVRSVIYIFFTKMAFALIIEGPIENAIYGFSNAKSILINLVFPPVLMYFIGRRIKIPTDKNTALVVERINNIVFLNKLDITENERRVGVKKKRGFFAGIFTLIYFLAFVLSFGGVIYLLHLLNFSPVSMSVFLFFLSVVSFFGYVIKESMKDILIVREDGGVFSSIFDFFFLPVLRVGKRLSAELARINVFVFVLDFIIEAPLKTIIEVVDEWFDFVREKKEEVA